MEDVFVLILNAFFTLQGLHHLGVLSIKSTRIF